MINNPISVQVDLLSIQQLTLPHAASTEERVLVESDAVLVEAAPLGLEEEVAHKLLLDFFEVLDAEGAGEFVVGLLLEAFVEGLLAVDFFEDLLVVVGVLLLQGRKRRNVVGSGSE